MNVDLRCLTKDEHKQRTGVEDGQLLCFVKVFDGPEISSLYTTHTLLNSTLHRWHYMTGYV